jgi:hypothetical protein
MIGLMFRNPDLQGWGNADRFHLHGCLRVTGTQGQKRAGLFILSIALEDFVNESSCTI